MITFLYTFHFQQFNFIRSEFKNFGLSASTKQFAQNLKNINTKKINGQKIYEVLNQSNQRQIILRIAKQTDGFLQRIFQNSKSQLRRLSKLAKQQIQHCAELKNKNFLTQFIKQMNLAGSKGLQKFNAIRFDEPKILCSFAEFKILEGFFNEKQIKSANLLYRASQYNFQIFKFHQKCDGIPNTLTLVETKFGKKIGGFTPLKWKSSNHGYQKDDSKQSFVFSISNIDKFTLSDSSKAILNHKQNGPIFGNSDLYIFNNSNKNNSLGDINKVYKNKNYQNEFRQVKFSGSNDNSFKTKKWQVWQIEFQEQTQQLYNIQSLFKQNHN